MFFRAGFGLIDKVLLNLSQGLAGCWVRIWSEGYLRHPSPLLLRLL
ncbi:unnamed protein product [Ectocarpus sp. CCAP 1310/34]|nr:unnamed protein product [Ectocarpus sp. CCAP 1310/34]